MKIKYIYDAALRALGMSNGHEFDCDYAERAPYLIATFCSDAAQMDRDYRETHKLPAQEEFNEVYLPLEQNFPLYKRFSRPAVFYLASMLVIEENEALSERMFEIYCDALSTAVSEIPFKKGKTVDIYPY